MLVKMRKERRGAPLLAASLALLLAGCGGDFAGPDAGHGEVGVLATGAAPAADGSGFQLAAPAQAATAHGTVSFQATITLIGEAGEELALTPGLVSGTVRIEGGDSVLIAQQRARVGTYPRARVTFRSVQADVTGGLQLGGIPVLGRIDVAIPPQGVTLEAPIGLEVEPLTSHTLILDLRAPTWLPTANLLTRSVSAATFAESVVLRER